MTDRFDEMAGRVQMDLAAFAMPTGTSARRVIADALRAAHARGVDEAAATIDQLRVELVTAQHEVGEAWFAGGATLEEAIRRKSAFLARSALACAINGRRRFFGPVLCVPGRDGWAGEVWLHDPEKRERGSGLAFESLARLRELHPELWIVRTEGDGILLDVCPIPSEASRA